MFLNRNLPITRPIAKAALFAAWLLASAFAPAAPAASPVTKATDASERVSLAVYTKAMQRQEGFLPLYWQADEGRVYLEIPSDHLELLLTTTLTQGLGSNDVGLDRGQISPARLVRFERVGRKLLMIQPNQAFRADSPNPDERRAVEQSFASSVLWGFAIVAEDGGRVLVDATDFVLRDGHGAIASIKAAEQGTYALDEKRSAIHLAGTKAFPRNTEIEATLTFAGDAPGKFIEAVTPTPQAISLRERYSFIALPEPGYRPREARIDDGFITVDFADYASPISEPLARRLLVRHRLERQDHRTAVGPAIKPIIYYLDRGAPSPIREALLEGGRWWAAAFEAAGYRDAFRVELMPEGMDPLDVRYHVIQWVHRATRGWSYGHPVHDPRTGEIIKGNVSLGSLRVRYDYLIAEGLLSPHGEGAGVTPALEKLALARLAQLAAHEIGHTLGVQHNYIASHDGRTSVMDYPQPLVELAADGSLDLASAYTREIGRWDRQVIDYGYRDFAPGTDENAALDALLAAGRAAGLGFLTDEDARSPGSAHPDVNLWDNGRDNAVELRRMMAVRKAALARFGDNAIRRDQPLATLEEALVPLYLHHRYQIDATAKALGGSRYVYAQRGDGQIPVQAVPAAEQRAALDALLETLEPEALRLSPALLTRLPPRPPGWPAHRELFARQTGPTFDAIAPAAAASSLTIRALLNPERAARLVQQHARDAALPDFEWLLDRLIAAGFAPGGNGVDREIRHRQQVLIVDQLTALARSAPNTSVRGMALLKLDALVTRSRQARNQGDSIAQAQAMAVLDRITRAERAADTAPMPVMTPDAPPGPPLGDG